LAQSTPCVGGRVNGFACQTLADGLLFAETPDWQNFPRR
jgi:hypothetical protein